MAKQPLSCVDHADQLMVLGGSLGSSHFTAEQNSVPSVGLAKRLFFTWFQPGVLFLTIGFWLVAPDNWATPAAVVASGAALRATCLVLEWFSERYASWRLTWKELATDLLFVALVHHVWLIVVPIKYLLGEHRIASLKGATQHADTLPPLATSGHVHDAVGMILASGSFVFQVFLTIFMLDLGQYALHRGMHKWYPLWLLHAPHHFLTQLNTLKEAVGNLIPVYLSSIVSITIAMAIGRLFDFEPRVALAASGVATAIGIYAHANVRFYTPRWWMFLFNTVEHHSLHHSRGRESTRCNYALTFILIDRIFGTFADAEAELVGQECGRRMSFREQMLYPVRPLIKWTRTLRRNAKESG